MGEVTRKWRAYLRLYRAVSQLHNATYPSQQLTCVDNDAHTPSVPHNSPDGTTNYI